MTIGFDPYSVLGVSRSASADDIKRAYRRLAQRLHPDRNPNNPGAAAQFQDVTSAYNILSDTLQRRHYDEDITPKEQETEEGYFTLRVTLSKRALSPLPEEQIIYLLAEIFASPQSKDRPQEASRLNLTLVLDHSNSMRGVRIERVKISAQQIIDSLSEKDILSVVAFNDRPTITIPATPVVNKVSLKARVSLIRPSGSTELFKALEAGLAQNRTYLGSRMVNHIVLITDGHTYGDEESCFQLAQEAAKEGIGISAMGLGQDWNDDFLDRLTGITGGSTTYVDSVNVVTRFLDNRIRSLSNAFAERMALCVAPDPDVKLEMAFKLTPDPQPLDTETGVIPVSSLQAKRPISLLLQFQMPANLPIGFRTIARLVASGEILHNERQPFQAISDISLEVTDRQIQNETPDIIMDALSKLTLYRLQERAQQALEEGDIVEATRKLENLATRLLEMGEDKLAHQALSEAQNIAHTHSLSKKGRKAIKYQTRALLGSGEID